MDIRKAKTVGAREEKGIVVHVKDERGVKLYQEQDPDKPVTVKLVGSYSTRARRVKEAGREELFAARAGADEAMTLADRVLAECILEWDGFTSDGAPYPCTVENALALFEVAPWILEQLQTAHNNHAAFFSES